MSVFWAFCPFFFLGWGSWRFTLYTGKLSISLRILNCFCGWISNIFNYATQKDWQENCKNWRYKKMNKVNLWEDDSLIWNYQSHISNNRFHISITFPTFLRKNDKITLVSSGSRYSICNQILQENKKCHFWILKQFNIYLIIFCFWWFREEFLNSEHLAALKQVIELHS